MRTTKLTSDRPLEWRKIPSVKTLDDTVALLRDPYEFIGKRCKEVGSDVFVTRLLMQETICLSGAEAAQVFYEDELFTRVGAAPLPLTRTIFGPGGIQATDGELHRARKQLFLSFYTPDRRWLLVDRFLDLFAARQADWQLMDEVCLQPELERLLCQAVCEWAGLPVSKESVAATTRDLVAMIEGGGVSRFVPSRGGSPDGAARAGSRRWCETCAAARWRQ